MSFLPSYLIVLPPLLLLPPPSPPPPTRARQSTFAGTHKQKLCCGIRMGRSVVVVGGEVVGVEVVVVLVVVVVGRAVEQDA